MQQLPSYVLPDMNTESEIGAQCLFKEGEFAFPMCGRFRDENGFLACFQKKTIREIAHVEMGGIVPNTLDMLKK